MSARGHATWHWIRQRATSLALLPLAAWFLACFLSLPDPGYDAVSAWLGRPSQALLMLLFGGCATWHSAQGVRSVLDDYATGGWHATLCWGSRLLHVAAALAVAWAIWAIARGAT